MENIISSIKNIITEVVAEVTEESQAQVAKRLSKYSLDNKITEIIMKDIGKFATVKKLKDPDAPKRAVTAYILYYKENANTIKSKYGLSSAPQVSKKAGELWSNLSSKEKSKYEKIALKDKDRYDEEKKAYRPPSQEEIKQKIDTVKEEKKLKDPNAPKKWKSAYMFFALKNRATIKEETGLSGLGEISKEIAKRWKELEDEEKAEYVEMETNDKERYKDEMSNYERPSIEQLREIAATKPKRKTSSKVSRKSSDGIKKPRSGYIFFCTERRITMKEEHPEYSSTEIMSELGAEWKALDAEEKEKYQEMAKKDKERYVQEKKEGGDLERKVPSRKNSEEEKKPSKKKSDDEEEEEEEEENVHPDLKKATKITREMIMKNAKKYEEEKKASKKKSDDEEEEEDEEEVSFKKPKKKAKKINIMNEEDFGDYSD